MKNTLVLMSTNRTIQDRTMACVRELVSAGARPMIHKGAPSDVAVARNIALSAACDYMRNEEAVSAVLCVDDDMEFSTSTAQSLVDAARDDGIGASAVYGTIGLSVAAGPLAGRPGRFEAGLGLLAIARNALLELERESEKFEISGKFYTEFVWCCADDGVWIAEDYRLCRRLGGVLLLPLPAGHLKIQAIWPDSKTLSDVAEGKWSPQRGLPSKQQRR